MSDVDDLARVLGFLPAPARPQFATALFDLGVRLGPKPTGMPNSVDKLNQCVLIAKVLKFLPPASRKQFATALFDLGVRVHPELATQQELIIGGRVVAGDPPSRVKNTRDNRALVREWAPQLAAKMDAAITEEQKQQVRAEIEAKYPALISEAKNRAATANYEDAR